jgi:penicillin-binding protein 1A
MLRDVVRKGTATAALRLKRSDLAGKTGTTNDAHDAWFAGYQPGLAGVAWVGHDRPRKLGDRETGGGLALPIWVDAMEVALRGVPESNPEPPAGVVQVNGEWYYTEFVPGKSVPSLGLTDEPPSLSGAADRARSPN